MIVILENRTLNPENIRPTQAIGGIPRPRPLSSLRADGDGTKVPGHAELVGRGDGAVRRCAGAFGGELRFVWTGGVAR